MFKINSKDLEVLEKPIKSVYYKYLIPAVLSMMSFAFIVFFDTMIIGQGVGEKGLAALNIVIPVYNLFASLGLMIGFGGGAALSICKGKKDYEGANTFFTVVLTLTISFGVIISIIATVFTDPICTILGSNEMLEPYVKEYLRVLILFAPSFITVGALNVIARNDNAPKVAMISMTINAVLNIGLDVLFVLVFKWGMTGAIWATSMASIVSLIIMSTYFIKNSSLKYNINLFSVKNSIRVFKNGMAIFILEFSNGIVIILFNNVIISLISESGVATFSIITNVVLVFIAILDGMTHAAQPIISVNYGAGKIDRIKTLIKHGIVIIGSFGVIFYILSYVFSRDIVEAFGSNNEEFIVYTIRSMRIYFIMIIFSGINMFAIGIFQSMEKRKISGVISLMKGIGLVTIFIQIIPRILGEDGLWLVVPAAEFITLLFSSIMIVLLLRKSNCESNNNKITNCTKNSEVK
ncbi:MATE family efflux transporter [Oceanirhabdus seepicola]|uniref:MATE family efflux transporter n=1 Tax=Oceanirhabdus seepicola TaxID=2828781 RepID=UPI0020321913